MFVHNTCTLYNGGTQHLYSYNGLRRKRCCGGAVGWGGGGVGVGDVLRPASHTKPVPPCPELYLASKHATFPRIHIADPTLCASSFDCSIDCSIGI